MIVLALDTSTPCTVVGLLTGDGRDSQAVDLRVPGQRPGHQERALPLAAELLDAAAIQWSAIDRIVVGVGPGTYTGLRVGVATARSLAQSLGVDLVGVSSLQALAAGAFATGVPAAGAFAADTPAGPPARVLTVVDARRREVFVGAYERPTDSGAPPLVLREPTPVATDGLAAWLAAQPDSLASASTHDPVRQEAVRGGAAAPAPASWLVVGDGACAAANALAGPGVVIPAPDSPLHRVDGVVLCRLGAHTAPQSLDAVVPDYRRRPDAEIALATATADALAGDQRAVGATA